MKKRKLSITLFVLILLILCFCSLIKKSVATEENLSFYEQLMANENLSSLYGLLIDEKNKDAVEALNKTEIDNLFQRVEEIYNNIAEPTNDDKEYKELLDDTLTVLKEGLEGTPQTLADETWSAQTISSSTTKTISGTITMNGTTTINSGATLTIKGNGTIIRGSSHKGVLFLINAGGKLVIEGSTTSNSAICINGNGEILSVSGDASIIKCAGSLSLKNVKITNNKISDQSSLNYSSKSGDTTTYNTELGGAVWVTSATTSTDVVSFENCVISDCASGMGAALELQGAGSAIVNITKTIIENCTAYNIEAGVIRTNGQGKWKLTIKNSVLRNNESVNSQGGLFYWNASGEGALLDIVDSQLLNNKALKTGGAAFLEGSQVKIRSEYTEGTMTEAIETGNITEEIVGTLIKGNEAGDGGGAICINSYGGSSSISGISSTDSCNVELGDFVRIEKNSGGIGGAIFLNIYDACPAEGYTYNLLIAGAELIGNTSTGDGGAIAIRNESTGSQEYDSMYNVQFNMTSGLIKDNISSNLGGGIWLQRGNATINDGTIQNSKAINGGGIYISNGDITMNGGSISNNQVTANGGAVCVNGGDFTMNGGLMSYNNSIEGGAVYITDGNCFIISGEISYNIATNEGGAVYANGGSIVIGIEDCTDENNKHEKSKTHPNVTENTAIYGGGGFITDGTITMYCGVIRGNTSNNEGTGNNVYMNGGTFELAGGTIGEETNPGVVLVGGELNDTRESDGTQEADVTMVYHSCLDNVSNHEVNVTAGKYVNVPAAQLEWTKTGYTMVGWTTSEDIIVRTVEDYKSVGMAVKVEDTDEDGEIHYYAVWAKTPGIITYELDGGTITGTNVTSYEYSVIYQSIKLISPEKPYYTFIGWRLTATEDTITNWETYYPENEDSVFYEVSDQESGLDLNIGTHFGDITLTAVYEQKTSNLEIIVKNSDAKNQSYIFEISGEPSNGNDFKPLKVAVVCDEEGNGNVIIKNIPVGEYTVTSRNNWTWRYELSTEDIESATNVVIDNSKETHTITLDEINSKNNFWLNVYNHYIRKEND